MRSPRDEDGFCTQFKTAHIVLARIRLEPEFWSSVVAEVSPWLARVADVKSAVLQNALNPTREDQWVWIKRYSRLVNKDFLHDDEDK